MNRMIVAAIAGLGLAPPAQATGGLFCSTAGRDPLTISLVIGRAAVPSVVSARLADGEHDVPVALAQSWIDDGQVLLDLVDPDAMRHEARLSARKRGQAYDGSLWRGGIRRWVRCRER